MKESGNVLKKKDIALKVKSLRAIRLYLVSEYGISRKKASELMKASGIEQIFDMNPRMAAHTSYKTWAKRAYDKQSSLLAPELSKALSVMRTPVQAQLKLNTKIRKPPAVKRNKPVSVMQSIGIKKKLGNPLDVMPKVNENITQHK